MDLMERMGTSVGLHTAGVPFISSALLSVVSFAMPQLTLWGAIFQWFSWPAHAVFAGIIPTGLLYCLLIFPSMTLFSRGFLAALKFYLVLIFLTAALAAGNLIYAFTLVFIFSEHTGLLIGALVGVLFSAGSISYSSKEIARLCSLSPRTVEAHRANIFSKLEVNSLPKLLKIYADIASGSK